MICPVPIPDRNRSSPDKLAIAPVGQGPIGDHDQSWGIKALRNVAFRSAWTSQGKLTTKAKSHMVHVPVLLAVTEAERGTRAPRKRRVATGRMKGELGVALREARRGSVWLGSAWRGKAWRVGLGLGLANHRRHQDPERQRDNETERKGGGDPRPFSPWICSLISRVHLR